MANPIPKWVMARYAKLWKHFDKKTFEYESMQKILLMDDKRVISVFINELKNAGWIDIKLNPKDTRKRLYSLKSPLFVVEEIAKIK